MIDSMTLDNDRYRIFKQYQSSLAAKQLFLWGLVIVIALFTCLGTAVGVFDIPVPQICRAIAGKIFQRPSGLSPLTEHIIINIRLPRILLGLVSGCGLGIAGAVMQGVLRNPMASPYTLGISSGASFGATLAIVLNISLIPGTWGIIVNAFAGAMLCALLIIGISAGKNATPVFMILTGIALMFLFSATTTLLQYFAEDEAVKQVVFWMVGSLGTADWMKIRVTSLVLAVTSVLIFSQSWQMNILGYGDETATSLGVPVKRIRIVTLLLSVFLTSTIVCFVGTIGFIGLVAPHICRMVIGSDNKYLIPMAGLSGGLLLAGADLLSANIISPVEIPVGIITAYMGVPLFLLIIVRKLGRGEQ